MHPLEIVDARYRRPLSVVMLLSLSSAVSLGLLMVRWVVGGRFIYAFMGWNLFLAWVPFGFALALYWGHFHGTLNRSRAIVLGVLWFLFFPNAPYLLTEFVHLGPRHDGPWWCDLLLTTGFAWNGLLLGLLSLFLVQRVAGERLGAKRGWMISALALALGSFGISLGRFQRFNSWDVLAKPVRLLEEVAYEIVNPAEYPKQFAMAVLLCAFLSLAYLTLLALISLGRDDVQTRDPGIGGMPGSGLSLH
ncbi:MAG TPA: DUF1361 domain-containing protein [Tepidisphaeraceae bacterium]|jgi:uncharacterized membrane protein|nr:DUF1361 domain-containing protein [Tepidisphaeraceae bacterium]